MITRWHWCVLICVNVCYAVLLKECSGIDGSFEHTLPRFSKSIIPDMKGKIKGDAGKIGVIGGSTEYTGAPYFAAISALKVGADLVYVITTENAAPIIKSYSPDLIVYPYLQNNHVAKISALLRKMDVIVIGPGLGRDDSTLRLIFDIIKTCNDLTKPLIIDADGLYFLSKNMLILQNYPSPGAILTPNVREADKLKVAANSSTWFRMWGENVSVLVKGEEDKFYSSNSLLNWSSAEGGTGRRAGGQGDILSGSLGTFFNWAIKSRLCENNDSVHLAHSVATYAAAKFTRECNSKAFDVHGRSLTASDMLNYIHVSFDNIFNVI
ncbi:ATP-dependent (S)-NAD(P)H-hydrate dehydratase-like [Plodia interpunctella]|uniref:ATP-dependent (S)-NAD(P)H-hydrate dehydratase-like n=1 Tax=Plodia interpunctella TaxID=58824 RepID=UPI002367940D|nr:ATP-dependent (S)-NAD(P)H-hydrate dehydratase-like [Plodia interpunctella]